MEICRHPMILLKFLFLFSLVNVFASPDCGSTGRITFDVRSTVFICFGLGVAVIFFDLMLIIFIIGSYIR